MAGLVHLGVITDLHAPRQAFNQHVRRRGDNALDILGECFWKASEPGREGVQRSRISKIIDLGDAISGYGKQEDRENLALVVEKSKDFDGSIRRLPGNNERKYLEHKDWFDVTEETPFSSSEYYKGLHLVYFRPEVKVTNDLLPNIEKDLAWLDSELKSAEAPSIVFSHAPIFTPEAGLETFLTSHDVTRGHVYYPQHRELQDILDSAPNLIGVINGHLHIDHFEVKRPGYFCMSLQSATECVPDAHEPYGAFAFIGVDIDRRVAHIERHGYGMYETTVLLRPPEQTDTKPELILPPHVAAQRRGHCTSDMQPQSP